MPQWLRNAANVIVEAEVLKVACFGNTSLCTEHFEAGVVHRGTEVKEAKHEALGAVCC